jgi:hypothetical protein
MSYRIACFLNLAYRLMPKRGGCALAARPLFALIGIAL